MFNDEQMKFKFHDKQVLTTYAYEIPKAHKKLLHRNQFVHVAQVDLQGQIRYHSFPRLVTYTEMEPLKSISFKIYKGLKTLIQEVCGIEKTEKSSLDPPMAEFNWYN